ncbi:hypothetical protein D3H55_22305 [Bacillus salacetis]|uniref:Uncharacterized protein n=1 Tax=Bacillus salacetis TaxID=2315464 RepID=A0A3A1QMK7_9BACI|nr:hypothetical protein D3H55_22305 [Bacillus salacetis]
MRYILGWRTGIWAVTLEIASIFEVNAEDLSITLRNAPIFEVATEDLVYYSGECTNSQADGWDFGLLFQGLHRFLRPRTGIWSISSGIAPFFEVTAWILVYSFRNCTFFRVGGRGFGPFLRGVPQFLRWPPRIWSITLGNAPIPGLKAWT